MIAPDIAFHDLDPTAWRHAQRLLRPPRRSGEKRPAKVAPLLLFVEGGVTVKALRPGGTPQVALAADFPWAGSFSLGKLRRALKAPWAVAVEDDALERVYAQLDGRVTAGEDFVAQGLTIARAFRAEMGKGLHLDPDPLAHVPIPPYAALQKTVDTLLPDGRTAALLVYDRGTLWSSLIIEKRAGDVSRVTTHAALGLPPQKLTSFRDGAHRAVLDAIEHRFARPHLAAFFTLDAWREVIGVQPGALARQVAMRNAVIDPAPPWLLALTGMGAMAGVAQEAGRLLGRFIPQTVKDTARALSVTPFAALGFDPIALYLDVRKVFES